MAGLAGHATAESVFRDVERQMPGVSLPTVYATLELLDGLGLVRRVATERGAVVYDARTSDHHHLACRRCGAMVDVEAPVEVGALLAAARSSGFAPDRADVVIRGLCAACAAG
jgi:Fe2+ or Zn2+ uptake regulation protein